MKKIPKIYIEDVLAVAAVFVIAYFILFSGTSFEVEQFYCIEGPNQ